MAKIDAKKSELDDDIQALSAQIDQHHRSLRNSRKRVPRLRNPSQRSPMSKSRWTPCAVTRTQTTSRQRQTWKTQEFKGLDTEITELASDKCISSKELAAVMEYYGKIKDRCIVKPETYEDHTARRTAEIAGLKQAQQILDEQTAFSRVRKRGLKVAKLGL